MCRVGHRRPCTISSQTRPRAFCASCTRTGRAAWTALCAPSRFQRMMLWPCPSTCSPCSTNSPKRRGRRTLPLFLPRRAALPPLLCQCLTARGVQASHRLNGFCVTIGRDEVLEEVNLPMMIKRKVLSARSRACVLIAATGRQTGVPRVLPLQGPRRVCCAGHTHRGGQRAQDGDGLSITARRSDVVR